MVVGRELSIPDIATVVDALRGLGGDGSDNGNSSSGSGGAGVGPLVGNGEAFEAVKAGGAAAVAAGSRGAAGGVRVEAFVHGALCVSYSGQCLSSEAWGGRSANRGQCAQACRMPYGLVVDGGLRGLVDDASYLLSPQVGHTGRGAGP